MVCEKCKNVITSSLQICIPCRFREGLQEAEERLREKEGHSEPEHKKHGISSYLEQYPISSPRKEVQKILDFIEEEQPYVPHSGHMSKFHKVWNEDSISKESSDESSISDTTEHSEELRIPIDRIQTATNWVSIQREEMGFIAFIRKLNKNAYEALSSTVKPAAQNIALAPILLLVGLLIHNDLLRQIYQQGERFSSNEALLRGITVFGARYLMIFAISAFAIRLTYHALGIQTTFRSSMFDYTVIIYPVVKWLGISTISLVILDNVYQERLGDGTLHTVLTSEYTAFFYLFLICLSFFSGHMLLIFKYVQLAAGQVRNVAKTIFLTSIFWALILIINFQFESM